MTDYNKETFEIEKPLTDEQLDSIMLEAIVPKNFITESDFTKLASIDLKKYASVLKKTYIDKKSSQEKSMSFSYLAWAVAFQILLSVKPSATFGTREWLDPSVNMLVPYLKTPLGYMVETWVEVDTVVRKMSLPVMDQKNKIIKDPDMFDINKSIMRCYVKNLALFGIGIQFFNKETELDLEKLGQALNNPSSTNINTKNAVEQLIEQKCSKHGVTLEVIAPALKKWYPDSEGKVSKMKANEIEKLSSWLDSNPTSYIKENLGVK